MTKYLKNKDFTYRYSRVILVYVVLIGMIVFASIFSDRFLSMRNLRSVVFGTFPLMMVAFGVFGALLTGGVDISLGMIVSLTNVVCISLMNTEATFGWVLPIIASIAVGIGAGLLNGILVAKLNLQPMIMSIAMQVVYGGCALLVMPRPGGQVHKGFAKFMTANIGGFPLALVFIIVLAAILRLIITRTTYGRSLRAIGENSGAAFSAGIDVVNTKIKTYMLAGFLASIGGIFLSGYMGAGDPTIGSDYSLNSVASCVVGGVSLSGAAGDMIGVVAGVFTMSLISNVLNMVGISSYLLSVIQGIILIVALGLSGIRVTTKE